MQIRIDIKSVLAGLFLGVILFMVMGQDYSGSGKSDFAISIEGRSKGFALVRSYDGTVYTVDPVTAKAEIIEYQSGPNRGRAFNLNLPMTQREK